MWQASETDHLATGRSIRRARSVPKHCTILLDSPFELEPSQVLPRRKSYSKINFDDLEPLSPPQSPIREASPTTPPDFQLLYQFGSYHPRSAQNQITSPSSSATPGQTTTVHTTPFQPTSPHLAHHPLAPVMAAWYAPLVLPPPLAPLPNKY